MNDLMVGSAPVTMTSMEIAELVGSRHDKVKQSIERLVERGVIVQPPLGDEQGNDAMGRPRTTQVYRFSGDQGKRDSYVVVAQLSPEFTGRLVDRWRDLEGQLANKQFAVPQTLPEALRLAADLAEQKHKAELALAVAAPKAQALDRIANADGTMCLTDAAKDLQVRPKALISYLSSRRWIYKRAGNANWIGYQGRIQSGYLVHKTYTVKDDEGFDKVRDQVRVTAKGLARLAEDMRPSNPQLF